MFRLNERKYVYEYDRLVEENNKLVREYNAALPRIVKAEKLFAIAKKALDINSEKFDKTNEFTKILPFYEKTADLYTQYEIAKSQNVSKEALKVIEEKLVNIPQFDKNKEYINKINEYSKVEKKLSYVLYDILKPQIDADKTLVSKNKQRIEELKTEIANAYKAMEENVENFEQLEFERINYIDEIINKNTEIYSLNDVYSHLKENIKEEDKEYILE